MRRNDEEDGNRPDSVEFGNVTKLGGALMPLNRFVLLDIASIGCAWCGSGLAVDEPKYSEVQDETDFRLERRRRFVSLRSSRYRRLLGKHWLLLSTPAQCLFGLRPVGSHLRATPFRSPGEATTRAYMRIAVLGPPLRSCQWRRNRCDCRASRQGVGMQSQVLTILVGAHGLAERAGTEYFLRKLFAYTDGLRAHGIKVAAATILPEYHPENPSYDPIFSKRRAEANAAIRAAVGAHIDAVIDFAADPVMGPDWRLRT